MECMQSTLDIFSTPPIDTSIDHSEDVQILPLSGVTNDAAIDLVVPAQTSQYIDLSKSLLYIKVKISRSDNKPIDAKKVSLIPLWPQALFRQIDMYLGQTLISTSTNQSAYRSWIETFLSYSQNVKNDQLDVLEHVGGTVLTEKEKSSCVLEALTRLNLDMMQQSRYLLNGVSVSLRLYRNSDAFIFKNDDDVTSNAYSLNIEDISLYIRHVTPSSSILLEHTRRLAQQTAIYPIDRSWVKTMHITKGMQEETFSNVFMGQLPNRMIIGLVKTTDYSGDFKTNPFTFKHFNLSHISLNVNGKQVPMRALEPNFPKGQFRRCYYNLMETVLGPCLDERSIGLSEEDYISNGKTFFGFSITPDGNSNHALSSRVNGNINIHLKFRTALTDNITVIVYSELQNKIEIDAARNVYTDYGF